MTKLDSFIRFFVPGTLIVDAQGQITGSFLIVSSNSVNNLLVLLRSDGKIIRADYRNTFDWFQQYGKHMRVYSPEGIEHDLSLFYWEYVA